MTVNPDVDSYAKTLNHRKIIRKTQKQQTTENETNTKTEISLKVAVRFSHLDCLGGILPSASSQLRHFLWYIVLAHSQLSLLYCNKIRAGGVA